MTVTIVLPPDGDANLYEADGKLYLYAGRFIVSANTVTAVPCRGLTDTERAKLLAAPLPPFYEPVWRGDPGGLATSCSLRVDVDGAIDAMLNAADTIDGWATR